ncbi:MAG: hypothetical protein IJS40_04295 [Synergistaceae bacterium]|nr:hypothetical protein [Synergistaceae bacterium]
MQNKKRTSLLGALLTLAIISFMAYATSEWFYGDGAGKSQQVSGLIPKTFFEFQCPDFFPQNLEIGPGDTFSVNPIITSDATIPMYCFFVMEMPVAYVNNTKTPIYDFNLNDPWKQIRDVLIDDNKATYIFQYEYSLSPGDSTLKLMDNLKMKEMSREDYAYALAYLDNNINIKLTGYACWRDDDNFNVDDALFLIMQKFSI